MALKDLKVPLDIMASLKPKEPVPPSASPQTAPPEDSGPAPANAPPASLPIKPKKTGKPSAGPTRAPGHADGNIRESVWWVANKLDGNLPDPAPSNFAYSLLKTVKDDPKMRVWFFETFGKVLLSGKGGIRDGDGNTDSEGLDVLLARKAEKFRTDALLRTGSEGPGEEHRVQDSAS